MSNTNPSQLSFVFLGLWLPKFTQIPASAKRHLLGVLDTARQCRDVLVNPAEHLWVCRACSVAVSWVVVVVVGQ